MPEYQGREARHHIQAPTEDQLDSMIEGLNEYAMDHGMESIEVLQRRPDPDGGWEATVISHNFNWGSAVSWVKSKFEPTRRFDIESGELEDVEPEEKTMDQEAVDPGKRSRVPEFLRRPWERHKEERQEEREFEERRRRGEVPPGDLSPKEQRAQIETARRSSEEVAKAAQRARIEERKRRPRLARQTVEAEEEARQAEERSKLLETELYGAPHVKPEEIIRDKWGREIRRVPLAAKRRLEAAELEVAQRKMTKSGIHLMEERFRAAEEIIREKRVAKRRGKILGPAREVARGIAGVVESVGRTGAGFGVRTAPYRTPPPPLFPTRRPGQTEGTALKGPDLSALRRLQTQPVGSGLSLFPTRRGTPKKGPRKKNTYKSNMKKTRRDFFGD